MYTFSDQSLQRLLTCDPQLQTLFLYIIKTRDCTVTCGRRPRELQDQYFNDGASKVRWPDSKHNVLNPWELSKAIDVAPYIAGKGIVYKANQCYYFAGYVMHAAQVLNIPIRWGGDWDGDIDVNDQNFNDLVHFELQESRLCSNTKKK